MAENAEIAMMSELILVLGLGSTLTDADAALLEMTKRQVEDRIRRHCRWQITEKQHVEYLPRVSSIGVGDEFMLEKLSSNRAAWSHHGGSGGDELQLPHIFVSSIARLFQDTGAAAGQGSGDFGSGTLLTSGTDYYLDRDASGEFCRSGIVFRSRGVSWSRKARTIKVVYTAGFTPTQLDEEYRDVKDACIEETVRQFKRAKSRQGNDGGGVGEVKSEMIGGEYSVTYTGDGGAAASTALSKEVSLALRPYRNMGLL